MIKKICMSLCVMGLGLSVASCGTYSAVRTESKPQLVAEPDQTQLMIADAADRATRALESLAAVEQARTPSAASEAVLPNVPPDLQKAVTFEWAGPAEPLAQSLAAKVGYSFTTIGDKPASPILVSMNIYNEPIVEVLRDLGLQMGTRADLKLDADRRVIEIIYASTVNSPMATDGMSFNKKQAAQ